MENQPKKMLLLSVDPADVSFLSEIALTQQADIELASNTAELCSQIARYRADQSLAAIFVDVSAPAQFRQFEFEFQSKMGSALAGEIASMVHFISGESLATHREILQSPYFTFYSERKNHDFARSAKIYEQTFYQASEWVGPQRLSFHQTHHDQFFDQIKKELLSKGASAEWILKFKPTWSEMIETIFPARFEATVNFSSGLLRVAFFSDANLSRDEFRAEKFLHYGVSAMLARNVLVLFIPIFRQVAEAVDVFKFFKVET